MSTDTTPEHIAQDTNHEAILERVDEAILAVDSDWLFTYVNRTAATLIEQDASTLLGESLWEQVPEIADSQASTEFQDAIEAQEPRRFDMEYEPRDAWFTVRAYPSADGLTVCFHEVTDKRQQQLELQRDQRLFESVFNDTNDALIVADTDRRMTDFNPAAERLFGYDEADVVGEKSKMLYADPSAFEQQGDERFHNQAPERHDTYLVEYERADGTTFEGETVGTRLTGPDDQTLAFLGAIRDVTSKVEYERDIERRNRTLNQFHDITTVGDAPLEEQVTAVLDLACEYLSLETGVVGEIDQQEYISRHVSTSEAETRTRPRCDRTETFSDEVIDADGPFGFRDASVAGVTDHPAYELWHTEAYLGVPVTVDGELYGTLTFASTDKRPTAFSESEETFVQIVAQWVGQAISRQRSRDRATTERKRLRQIIDILPQLVFAKDESGTFLLANEAVAAAYGTTVSELEGATDAEFAASKAEAEQFRADDNAVIASGEPKYIPEEPLTTADGVEKTFATRKIPYDPIDTRGDAVLGVSTDITERKQREAELEVQAAAMEAAMDGISILDEDGEYIYMNEAHAAVFDHDPEELIGSSWRQVYADAEIKRIEQDVFPTLEQERQWRGETVGMRRDGSSVTQEITLSLLDDGKLICINRDITEQKARERELERKQNRLRALFDESPDGIIVHDERGEILDANVTQAKLLGYDHDELCSMNVAEFEGGHSRRDLRDLWRSMETDETQKVEGNHRRKTGSIYPVEVWISKTAVRGQTRFIAVSRDISDRKAREREMVRNREFLEKTQEIASVGGWEVDLETDELRWTDEVYRIHGLPVDAEVTVEDSIDYYHPDDRPEIIDAYERLVEDGDQYDKESRIVTPDDEVRWVRTVADPQLEDGAVVGIRGIFQDITERREREQNVRELKERLDLAVEGANLGVWDWDMTTDDVTFNDQWATMLGLSPDAIEPTLETWENRVHPADMDRVEAELESHMAGETELYDCEHRMQTADSGWKWVRDVGEVVERDDDDNPIRAVGIHLDISEQKESEKYLQEERDMFAQGPAVVFKWKNRESWPVEYVSGNVAEAFGYTPAELESGEVPYETLIHEDDIDRVRREVADHVDRETERFSHDPYRMVTADGSVRWVTDNTKIIRNGGEITHYLGYLVDITDRKRLEQSLRENERSLREMTTIASDTDRAFAQKLHAILELGCERLGLPYGFLNRIDDDRQHVVGAVGDHPDLQPGDTAPLSKAYCRRTIEQKEPYTVQDAVAEGWEDDPAYEAFNLGCYIGRQIVVDGETYGTLCFADRTNREHQFDETEQAFVKLLGQWISYELAGDAVKTKLRNLNETAQRLLSASDSEAVASIAVESAKEVLDLPMTGIWWYDDSDDTLVPAGMTDEIADLIGTQPTFRGGDSLTWQTFKRGEIGVYDDVHQHDECFNSDTPIRSEITIPLGDHGVLVSGATQPTAFSETDRGLFEILAATVETALNRAEREQVLRETRKQLETSNQELEQFAYAASHDLQEPLRTVSSYLTLLERRSGDVLDDDAVEFIEFAVDGADRMREMIQALLAYSRVDTNGHGFEQTAMRDVFETVRRNLEVSIDESDATVTLPDTAGHVAGDTSQLVQLFQNLVENAIKYTDSEPQVDISVTRSDNDVIEYAVADNGIGIDSTQQEEIFEVFQRLHTQNEFDGTGIGLSVCRKIVDRHDGEIRVESTPGDGSTFFVTLPIGGEGSE
jgi:PAS domain S-box-containing protein